MPVVTSYLNKTDLNPLSKYVTAYFTMHLLRRRKEKDKPCKPVDASYLSGMMYLNLWLQKEEDEKGSVDE